MDPYHHHQQTHPFPEPFRLKRIARSTEHRVAAFISRPPMTAPAPSQEDTWRPFSGRAFQIDEDGSIIGAYGLHTSTRTENFNVDVLDNLRLVAASWLDRLVPMHAYTDRLREDIADFVFRASCKTSFFSDKKVADELMQISFNEARYKTTQEFHGLREIVWRFTPKDDAYGDDDKGDDDDDDELPKGKRLRLRKKTTQSSSNNNDDDALTEEQARVIRMDKMRTAIIDVDMEPTTPKEPASPEPLPDSRYEPLSDESGHSEQQGSGACIKIPNPWVVDNGYTDLGDVD